jgi:hypothetical protein
MTPTHSVTGTVKTGHRTVSESPQQPTLPPPPTPPPPPGSYPDLTGQLGTYADGQQWPTHNTAEAPSAAAPQFGSPADQRRHSPRPMSVQLLRALIIGLVVAVVVWVVGFSSLSPKLLHLLHVPGSQTSTAPLVTEAALRGLLLSTDQTNTAMGATGITPDTQTAMFDESSRVSIRPALP